MRTFRFNYKNKVREVNAVNQWKAYRLIMGGFPELCSMSILELNLTEIKIN